MSSGRHHSHNLSRPELDDLLAEALANAKVRKRLARPFRLITSCDVAYLGSSSIGGWRVYLDQHLRYGPPKGLQWPYGVIPVNGGKLNVVPGLIRHERLEQALEDELGWPYKELAHPVAQHFEEKDYIAKGFDPEEVEKAFQPYIKADEAERLKKVPTDIDRRPELSLKDATALERIKAATNKEKRTHGSVDYWARSAMPNQTCAQCRRFIKPEYGGPGCIGVKDEISPGGWCRRFVRGVLGGQAND